MSLKGKTLVITGASRGIGKAIALKAAADGANIAVLAKTTDPNPKLPGTVFSAVDEINAAGGTGLAVPTDIRFEDQVEAAVQQILDKFGGIDILINNASAIFLAGTVQTPMKRFDLMNGVNVRGTYLMSQKCLPHLAKAENPHILNLSPPINLDPKWFAPHLAYTMAKYGMSLCVLGMAEEFRSKGIAVNALWPGTAVATSAVQNVLGGDQMMQRCRTPDICADAAWAILNRDSDSCTGNFFIDEDVMKEEGVDDMSRYAVDPTKEQLPDFFIG